jgi:Cdc6-like AAA superfamily ATPase
MPTLQTGMAEVSAEAARWAEGLATLKKGTNPFAAAVAATVTADESLRTDVREYAKSQLQDLLSILALYRVGRPASRVFTILGDPGTGKTHLLHVLLAELQQQAITVGTETLVVVVDRMSPGTNPTDYLLWQIINHLLSRKGDGARLLGVIAARLTARLLGETLCQLAPHQQADLIPSLGFWERFRRGFGSPTVIQRRLDAVAALIQRCQTPQLTAREIQAACENAGLPLESAVLAMDDYVRRTESNDMRGWFRRELYSRLYRITLLDNRDSFDEFHNGGFEQAPAHVQESQTSACLLSTWLELFAVWSIPVVVVFDQLENFLAGATDQLKEKRKYFRQAIASFIDNVPGKDVNASGVCVLTFAESQLWFGLTEGAEDYIKGRLNQAIALPGYPTRRYIGMPAQVDQDVVVQLIQNRIRAAFPEMDVTGLPGHFPFLEAELKGLSEPTLRRTLHRLAEQYDKSVFGSCVPKPPTKIPDGDKTDPPPRQLRAALEQMWHSRFSATAKEYGKTISLSTSVIPEVQTRLEGWLGCLLAEGLTGTTPWSKVELVSDVSKHQSGYLTVIRTAGPNLPGIGIAAWLGGGAARVNDLRHRLKFFKNNPCPVQTLILLRADGEDALTGETKTEYEQAIKAARDVRVWKYEAKHFHSLMAFFPWLKAVQAEVEAAGAEGRKVFREFVAELSKELLVWIDKWRQPATAKATLYDNTN